MKKIKASIIILNWNGKKVTADCLRSIQNQTYKPYEVIVVDNASLDGSVNYLKGKFPSVKFIENKTNLGYAGGNNVGIKIAQGDYILILNNDTVLDKDFLLEMAKRTNVADVIGAKNYYFDKKDIFWAVGSKVNEWTLRARLIGNKEKDEGQYDRDLYYHAVGSAIFANTKVFKKVGVFNESYFCYFEETEWQTRVLKAGFKIGFAPKAKLWHRVAYSSGGGRSPFSTYYLIRNRAYYLSKWARFKLIAYLVWFVEVFAKIFTSILSRDLKMAKASYAGCVDFFLRRKGATYKG